MPKPKQNPKTLNYLHTQQAIFGLMWKAACTHYCREEKIIIAANSIRKKIKRKRQSHGGIATDQATQHPQDESTSPPSQLEEQLFWRSAQFPHLESTGKFQNSWNLETWCISHLTPTHHCQCYRDPPQPHPLATQQRSYQQVTPVVLFSQLTLLSLFHTQHICHWIKESFTQKQPSPTEGHCISI